MFMMQAEDLFFIPHNKECLCIDIQVLAGLKFDRYLPPSVSASWAVVP